ncbi:MAG: hypothetical protein A2X94_04705 [Bdellovibrionales bacterium GWB1_55_8]|nr:MAG: hypothetical protein A2X94_04705 [Bdellovibrionales bacterium GWB1_55_8]
MKARLKFTAFTVIPAFLLLVSLAHADGPAPAKPTPACIIETLSSVLKNMDSESQARLAKAFASDPELHAQALELFKNADAGALSLQSKEAQMVAIRIGAKLQDSGELPDFLRAVAEEAGKQGKLPPGLSPEKQEAIIQQVSGVIDAELSARGLTAASKGAKYEDWTRLSYRLMAETERELEPLRKAGKAGFDHPEFVEVFERQTGAKFTGGNIVHPLINGPKSFKERRALIQNAKKSIRVLSWAFYDDKTGTTFAKELIAAKRRGVDVKIMVDGQVAMKPGHEAALKSMEDAGIEVVRWRSLDKLRKYDGQHRKMMIVDDLESISGGMNFGDVYSHMGRKGTPKWRDTDVYAKGEASVEANRLFSKLWNEQVEGHGLTLGKADVPPAASPVSKEAAGSARMSLVDHVPGVDQSILRATLLAIEGAEKNIDIENAYLIMNPAIYRKLLEAKKRGVRVRVLTNSSTSIDEPIITRPILRSVNHLVENGFEVYVKRGKNTLHSKFMTVDGKYSWVGSYNLHPRSERYEGEAIFNILDAEFTADLTRSFEADLRNAERVKAPFPLPKKATDKIEQLFYDQF